MAKLINNLEADAWYDPETDIIYTRVRYYTEGPNGLIKRGLIFKMTEEAFFTTCEGCSYVSIRIDEAKQCPEEFIPNKPTNRFDNILEETDDGKTQK